MIFKDKKIPIPLVIILSGFLLRITACFFITDFSKWEDTDIAETLLKTGEFKYFYWGQNNYTYQMPVFIFIQFVIFYLLGYNLIFISLFQIIISTITAGLFYYIINFFIRFNTRVNNKKNFWLTAIALLIFVFHPALIYYNVVHIHPFTTDMFFSILLIFVLLKLFKNNSLKWLIFSGMVYGITILERPTLVLACIPCILFIIKKDTFKKIVIQFLIINMIGFSISSFWLIRNYRLYGFVHFCSTTSEMKWLSILEQSEGSNFLYDGRLYLDAINDEEKNKIKQFDVKSQHDFFDQKYNEVLKNDPERIIKKYFVKLKNFWWFRFNFGNYYPESIQKFSQYYYFFYVLLLLMVISSLILSPVWTIIILSYPLFLSLFQSFYYVETRHRLMIEPFLIIIATSVFFIFISKIKKQKFIFSAHE